ncbi:MAG: YhfX family PLP-dependent enzyme [Bacilli bacterium]
MFLNSTLQKNKELIETSFTLHQEGKILPDSYVIDMDVLKTNARLMLEEAKKINIDLFFMLKQLGRNPYIAQELINIGYTGAVVVDFREAKVMMKHHIPIANVGHLVQMPKSMISELIAYGCKYMTLFSLEKAKDVNDCAKKLGIKQKILLKVVGNEDMIYSGQTAGFRIKKLNEDIQQLKKMPFIEIAGVTSFPCFLYDETEESTKATNNLETLFLAKKILQENSIEIENINAPSSTCTYTLKQMQGYGINSAEPGHGLSGTTPLHAHKNCEELPCVVYVSEVSHNFDGSGYCYGGGHYRRSHVKNALVGKNINTAKLTEVEAPSIESIDYYFKLATPCKVSDTVIMAFRFQIFVTRSNVILVEGIHKGNARILGTYNSLGVEVK